MTLAKTEPLEVPVKINLPDVDEVQRLGLGPDEILVIRSATASPRQIDDFIEWAKGTPLENRVIVLGPGSDMEVVRVTEVKSQIQRKRRQAPEKQVWENVFSREDRL